MRRLLTGLSGLLLVALGVAAIYQGVILSPRTGVQRDGIVTFGGWHADPDAHGGSRAEDTLREDNPALFWVEVGMDGLGGLVFILLGGFILVAGLMGKGELLSVEVTLDDNDSY